MPCSASSISFSSNESVTDFTKSNPYTPERIYRPENKQQLVAAIIDGASAGGQMKALGGNYSLSGAQVARNFLISTRKLNRHLSMPFPGTAQGLADQRYRDPARNKTQLIETILHTGATLPAGRHLVYVEAGIKVKQLLDDLKAIGLALPTMGSGGDQSLAGAISTGTHGSDFGIPPLSDFVRAIHIVGPGGREWWIEPSYGMVGGPNLGSIPDWCPDTYVIRDDGFFYSALVQVGRLGVIYALVLEVRDAYWLEDRSEKHDWSGIAAQLQESVQQGYNNVVFKSSLGGIPSRYYSVTIDLARGHDCWVTRRWETTNHTKELDDSSNLWMCDSPKPFIPALLGLKAQFIDLGIQVVGVPVMGVIWQARITAFWIELMDLANKSATTADFLIHALKKAADLTAAEVGPVFPEMQAIIRSLPSFILDMQHKPKSRGPSYAILDQHDYEIDNCYSGNSTEIFFDANNTTYLQFVADVLRESRDSGSVPGYVSLRYVGRSRAWLAMERWDLTVAIEVAVPRLSTGEDLYASFMSKVLELAWQHGGVPHWGQTHVMTPTNLEELYAGGVLEPFRWAIAELQQGGSSLFSSDFTESRGLELQTGVELKHHRSQRSGGVLAACHFVLQSC